MALVTSADRRRPGTSQSHVLALDTTTKNLQIYKYVASSSSAPPPPSFKSYYMHLCTASCLWLRGYTEPYNFCHYVHSHTCIRYNFSFIFFPCVNIWT